MFHALLSGNGFQGVAERSQGSPDLEPGFIPNFPVELIDHVSQVGLPVLIVLIVGDELGCWLLSVPLGPGSFCQLLLFELNPEGNFLLKFFLFLFSDLFFPFSQDFQPGFLTFFLFLFLCFVSDPVEDGTPGLTAVPGVLRLADILKSAVAFSAIMVLPDGFSQFYIGELGQVEGGDRDIGVLVLVHFDRDPGIIRVDCLVLVRVHGGEKGS